MSETYNGWTNYETWRVNLEMLDGMGCEDFGIRIDKDDIDASTCELAAALESYCVEMVEMDVNPERRSAYASHGLALDLALSFLKAVDWQEIAEHMVEDHFPPPTDYEFSAVGEL